MKKAKAGCKLNNKEKQNSMKSLEILVEKKVVINILETRYLNKCKVK